MLKGMDVSQHNGVINWNQVKGNVDFVMLRMGYGDNDPKQDDKQFEWNVSECNRLGIPWGAYLYSYALNVNQVQSEIDHAKRLLNGKNPQFPVCFDMEDADGYKTKHGMPPDSVLVDICYNWLLALESDGHYAMLYASLSWLNNQLNSSKLDRFDKWVAQWNDHCTYSKPYHMWQYTNGGFVNGVSGRVDLNFAYSNFKLSATQTYKIQSGDTLTKIALIFHTTVNQLLILNPNIKNPNKIDAGQTINVPRK
jgi:GH25 family lysozyme M1 (1,4-beta-N-acetylmuramidase)